MRKWLAGVIGAVVLVVSGFLVATSALATDEGTATVAADDTAADDRGEANEESQGPPAWAHGQAHARDMKRLVREHREGMVAFARCQTRGGDDCARPLPPGLARKR